jgi:hypothetical protein
MFGQSPLAATPFATLYGNVVYAAISETATGADVYTRYVAYAGLLDELVTGVDTYENVASFVSAIAEGVLGEDSPSANTVLYATITEATSGQDVYAALRNANVNVTGIQLYVIVGNALVWGVIDDSQNAGWTVITTTQTPTWTDIPT